MNNIPLNTSNYTLKRNLITDPTANVRELYKNSQYFCNTSQQDEIINRRLVQDLQPLLHETYQHFHVISESEELNNLENNARNYIKVALHNTNTISNKNLKDIAQIMRGERFLFPTRGKTSYHFEIRKANKKTNTPPIKEGERYVIPHIEKGAELEKMKEALQQRKQFSELYLADKKIRYGIYTSWLIDKDFLAYRTQRKEKHTNKKTSRIIETAERLKTYLAKGSKRGNIPIEEEEYETLKQKFILKKTKKHPTSLSLALDEYEKT